MNPLDQLADIQTPSEVSIWPLAWGYWLAIVVFLCCVIWLIYAYMKHRRYMRVRKQTLDTISHLDPKSENFAQQCQLSMKNLCAHYFAFDKQARHKSYSAAQWQQFMLDIYSQQKGQNSSKISLAIETLNHNIYAPGTDSEANQMIKEALIEWINHSITKPRKIKSAKDHNLPAESMAVDHV